jgi:hypothetical protein
VLGFLAEEGFVELYLYLFLFLLTLNDALNLLEVLLRLLSVREGVSSTRSTHGQPIIRLVQKVLLGFELVTFLVLQRSIDAFLELDEVLAPTEVLLVSSGSRRLPFLLSSSLFLPFLC